MNFATLIADAKETARLEGLRKRLWKEYHAKDRRAPGVLVMDLAGFLVLFLFRWALPALLPLVTLQSGRGRWLLIACLVPLVPEVIVGRSLVGLTEMEALRMPSREGLLLHRWLRAFPWFLWVGLSWALAGAFKVHALGGDLSVPAILLLAAVGLIPLLGAASLHGLRVHPLTSGQWPAVLLLATLLFLIAAPLDDLATWLDRAWLSWTGPGALLLCGALLPCLLRAQFRAFQAAEAVGFPAGRKGRAGKSTGLRAAAFRSSPFLARRPGLWRAQAYLGWKKDRLGLERPLVVLAGYLFGVWAVWAARDGASGLYLPAAAAFLASRFIGTDGIDSEESRRLYLLGVDYREQVLHDLKALLLVAAPLLLGIGLGTMLVLAPASGLTEVRLAVLACMAGFLLLRAGARGLPGISEASVLPQVLSLALLLVFLFVPRCGTRELLAAAALAGLLGFLGLLRRLLGLDDESLREQRFSRARGARRS
jgi:hypothetical protein